MKNVSYSLDGAIVSEREYYEALTMGSVTADFVRELSPEQRIHYVPMHVPVKKGKQYYSAIGGYRYTPNLSPAELEAMRFFHKCQWK